MLNATLEDVAARGARSTAYAAVFGAVAALGLPLNAAALWILLTRNNLKSPSVVFMVNLALSDLLLVAALTTRVYFYAAGVWPLGVLACVWFTMLFINNVRSSAIFITFISVDRLLAVVYPVRSRHRRTAANAWKAAALVWLFVMAANVPESLDFADFLNNSSESGCFEFSRGPRRSVAAYASPALVLAMLAVNVASTAAVSLTLRARLNDSARVKNKVNVVLIFAVNLAMFAVFFLPASLAVFFVGSAPTPTPLVCLASVNCCLDPLLYYFSFDGFWRRAEHERPCRGVRDEGTSPSGFFVSPHPETQRTDDTLLQT
ncbi:lysophosphatidic acid receptor 5b [Pseudoliparis swirei]|uniref:lysophosphatidic acid receptor 5b n=1 Tax=Pseudoliparis swirei TaxID=2059687 RepID=UPI0024BD8628|nr:lysophosphatidic acid receptor 5b [Pseudoliparis swirei]